MHFEKVRSLEGRTDKTPSLP